MSIYSACITAALIAFITAFLSGYVIIPLLNKLKFGQTILDIGPRWHRKKQGTPTMGGVMFIAATLISFVIVFFTDKALGGTLVFGNGILEGQARLKLSSGIAAALGFGFIGFIDDYIKVSKKQNLGLTMLQKTVLELVISLGYIFTLYINDPAGSMFVPFYGTVETGVGFWAIGLVTVYCTVNAVNFTDGVDGLCSSVTALAALSFVFTAALRNFFGISVLAAALFGGLLGYFIWNRFPARVMMGDTGSMFLGGIIVAFAYSIDCPLIIILSGIVYVMEFSSDIIQILYFKVTHGRRLLKMAPLHHHMELCGFKEQKIVRIFSAVGAVGGILAVALVYFGNLR